MFAAAFFLCFIAHLFQGILFPGFSLLAFTPFLAYSAQQYSSKGALWLAALSGLAVDLFSDHPFGLHALNYTLISALLYSGRRRFSKENPRSFALYTALFSASSTILQLILLFLFDRRIPLSGKWFLFDLIAMSLADGLYGLAWVIGPLALFQKIRTAWVFYWLRKKNQLFRKSP